jgi:hypothetical protein
MLVIGEVCTNPGIPDGGVIVKEKGNLIAQLFQGHGKDMGDDPHRLASHPCKDYSLHKRYSQEKERQVC